MVPAAARMAVDRVVSATTTRGALGTQFADI